MKWVEDLIIAAAVVTGAFFVYLAVQSISAAITTKANDQTTSSIFGSIASGIDGISSWFD